MPDAIEVRGLTKRYGDLAAVDGIDFRVREGEVFAFLGPNGAGKTTTVEVLEGIRRATSGEVRVFGLDPWTEGTELHQRIGVIPQEFRFFEKIHPKEAIDYYAALFGVTADASKLLKEVALEDKADARFDTLSGGQKQKLGLALSLVNDPRVCFLDEPTTGLDPQARRAIWEVIRTLKSGGRTVFLTTHYLEEAELLADKVAIIHHGKIIANGAPHEIIARYGHADRLVIEGPPSMVEQLRRQLKMPVESENGRVTIPLPDRKQALSILATLDASGVPWTRFGMESDTLEDVFVSMVGRMDEGEIKEVKA